MPFFLISTDPHPNTITPVTNPQTIVLNNITYWLIPEPYQSAVASVPAEQVPSPNPNSEVFTYPRATKSTQTFPDPNSPSFDLEDRIVQLHNLGLSRRKIQKELHITSNTIGRALANRGITTPFAETIKLVEQALANAGPRGLSSIQLNQIARTKGQLTGPLIMVMKRQGKMYKLPSGNWAAI